MLCPSFQNERKREVNDDKTVWSLHNQRQNSNHNTSCYSKTTKPQLEKNTTERHSLHLNLVHWNASVFGRETRPEDNPTWGPNGHRPLIPCHQQTTTCKALCPTYSRDFPFPRQLCICSALPFPFSFLKVLLSTKTGCWVIFPSLQFSALQ